MEKEVTLPVELATCGLTLSEIGAILVMFSYNKMDNLNKAQWCANTDYINARTDLKGLGIMEINKDEVIIDITKMEEVPFWLKLNIDREGNTSYCHDSLYEGSIYEAIPKLKDSRIVWEIWHSDVGHLEDFMTLEEAEKVVKEMLEDEAIDILRLEEGVV